jgi:hypothetical protein
VSVSTPASLQGDSASPSSPTCRHMDKSLRGCAREGLASTMTRVATTSVEAIKIGVISTRRHDIMP